MRTKEQMDKLNAFINSIGNPNAPPSSALTAAPLHLQFEPSDFIQLVESLHLNEVDELGMYLSAWHRFNDLRHEAQNWDLSPQHTEFLELILQKLNAVKPNDSLLKAELLRELSRFKEAAAELQQDYGDEKSESHAVTCPLEAYH